MSLDGLRAWIGEVERKLGMRTKVMLALAAIAIGAAGTAIYLVIDYRDKAVSESDVRELQGELEAQGGAGGTTEVAGLQAEIDALEAQVEELQQRKGKGGGAKAEGGATPGGGTGGTPPTTPSVPGLPEEGDLPSLP